MCIVRLWKCALCGCENANCAVVNIRIVRLWKCALCGCENVHCAVVKIRIELKSAVHFPRGIYCALMAELNSLFFWSPPQLVDNSLSSTTFKFLPAKVIIDPLSNYKAYKRMFQSLWSFFDIVTVVNKVSITYWDYPWNAPIRILFALPYIIADTSEGPLKTGLTAAV